ncbi:PGF-pre-PGF domain-containing protein [Methanosarcina hadiensis]|uniref:PGF-pre-PGF domain-containing protein n=1 Tax=Methanosarcina hadiensis TaxID=3078083 RepID=UPI003977AD91
MKPHFLSSLIYVLLIILIIPGMTPHVASAADNISGDSGSKDPGDSSTGTDDSGTDSGADNSGTDDSTGGSTYDSFDDLINDLIDDLNDDSGDDSTDDSTDDDSEDDPSDDSDDGSDGGSDDSEDDSDDDSDGSDGDSSDGSEDSENDSDDDSDDSSEDGSEGGSDDSSNGGSDDDSDDSSEDGSNGGSDVKSGTKSSSGSSSSSNSDSRSNSNTSSGSSSSSGSTSNSSSNSSSSSSSPGSTSNSSSNSSSSGSDSDSGPSSMGSGISTEPVTNIEVKELATRNVISGYHIEYVFPENVTCVTHIEYDAIRTFRKTTAIVEVLRGKSTLVPVLPEGEIYKHVNIWIGENAAGLPTSLENGLVGFRVEKNWIGSNNINESLVTLQWYNKDEGWKPLDTKKTGEDEKYLYFESQTPGYSFFAITEYNPEQGKTQLQKTLRTLTGRENGIAKEPLRAAKMFLAIALPLFMIIAGYGVLKKKI